MSSKNNQVEETTIDQLNSQLTAASEKVANNKNIILWAVVCILIIGAGIMAYIFLYNQPRTNKSNAEYAKVETAAMGNDSIAADMYKKVADQYKGTPGGNLAALSAGETLYTLGKYEEAAKYLEKFSTSDDVMMANAQVLTGDCYVNLNKYPEALKWYGKAIATADANPQIVPRVLLKEANVYEAQNNADKVLECYETIAKDFPRYQFGDGMTIEAYVEREKARLGK